MTRIIPAIIATAVAVVVAAALFVPYVGHQYQRRGEFGPGRAVLAFAVLLYSFGVFAYVLLPLPVVTGDFCSRMGSKEPQLEPLKFLGDIRNHAVGTGIEAYLHNPATTHIIFNAALFVPFGMFVRYLARRSMLVTIALGFVLSLFIETTQGTGNWFLYPCPYRLFDVDDLIANTVGAAFGACVAPLLRLVPGQRVRHGEPGRARPVTAARRFLGMVCDLLLYNFLNSCFTIGAVVVLAALRGELFGAGSITTGPDNSPTIDLLATWIPLVVLAVVLPLVGSGASAGQRIVQLEASTSEGGRAGVVRRLLRSFTGIGGFLLLDIMVTSTRLPNAIATTLMLLEMSLVVGTFLAVWLTPSRRGLSYGVTGLRLVDARTAEREVSEAQTVELERA